MPLQLFIGNKNYSSWSLRVWLAMRHCAIPFDEVRIPLYQDGHVAKIRGYSAAGKVPVLIEGKPGGGKSSLARQIVRDLGIKPERVIIDHVEEHTVGMVLDAGMWAGMTLYPESKCSPARAIDMLDCYGRERIWMNSACDWGVSIPLNVPRTALEMRKRGWTADAVDKVIYQNPIAFMSQCPKFKLP